MGISVFGNSSDIMHWKPNPTERGTFDILSICVITTSLCVWSAVHLNIPHPSEKWAPYLRKIKWMLFALIAPELVAFTAWFQRCDAAYVVSRHNAIFNFQNPASFRTKIRKSFSVFANKFSIPGVKRTRTIALEEQDIPESAIAAVKRRHPWTMTHGFYAIMGGYILQIPKVPHDQTFIPNQQPETWTIEPHFLDELWHSTKKSVVPDLSKDDIIAKSRATSFVKTFVCIQATWFCVQCFTRIANDLPISLLELNTFAHAVCALIIYVLWWEKPFDVDCGTPVLDEDLYGLRALKWMCENRTEASGNFIKSLCDQVLESNASNDKLMKNLQRKEINLLQRTKPLESIDSLDEAQPVQAMSENWAGSIMLKPGDILEGTGFQIISHTFDKSLSRDLRGLYDRSTAAADTVFTPANLPNLELDAIALRRWRLAWNWLATMEGGSSNGIYIVSKNLIDRSENVNPFEFLFFSPFPLMFASLVYGGIHLLAWNANFPSSAERILWRTSACIIICGGMAIGLSMNLGSAWISTVPDFWVSLQDVIPILLTLLSIITAILYILARIYLVVECFISLSHLPAAAYQVPNWSTYFPHIA